MSVVQDKTPSAWLLFKLRQLRQRAIASCRLFNSTLAGRQTIQLPPTMFRSITIANLAKPVSSAARLNSGRVVAQQARGYHEKVISHYERPRNVSSRPRLSDNFLLLIMMLPFLIRSAHCPRPTLTSVQDSSVLLRAFSYSDLVLPLLLITTSRFFFSFSPAAAML